MSAWPWRLGLANLSCAIFKITRRGRGRDNNKRGVVHNIVSRVELIRKHGPAFALFTPLGTPFLSARRLLYRCCGDLRVMVFESLCRLLALPP